MSKMLHLQNNKQLLFFHYSGTALLVAWMSFLNCRSPQPVFFYTPPGTAREVYKKNPDISITVYPHKFSNPQGSVIFIHGGGWQMGGSEMPFYRDWEELLIKAKLQAFSIEHRTAPNYRGNDIIADCMDAVRYINRNASRFGIPENRFALVGFSSGGHLALMTALRMNGDEKEKIKISSVVSYYSPVDLKILYREGNSQVKRIIEEFVPASSLKDENTLIQSLKDLSPYHNLHKRIPPVLLIHAMDDNLIPWNQSRMLYEKIRDAAPGKAEMILLKRGNHNFNTERNRETVRSEKRAVRFMIKHIRAGI